MATWNELEADPRWGGLDEAGKQELRRQFAQRAVTSNLPLDLKKNIMTEVYPNVHSPTITPGAPESKALDYLEGALRGVARGTPVSGVFNLDQAFAKGIEAPNRPSPTFEHGGIGPKITQGVARVASEIGTGILAGGAIKGAVKAPLFAKYGAKGLKLGVPAAEGAGVGALFGAGREGTAGEKAKHAVVEGLAFGALGAVGGAVKSAREVSKAAQFAKFPGSGKRTVAERTTWGFGRGPAGLAAAEQVEKLPMVVAQMPEKIFNAGMKQARANPNQTNLVSWLGEQGFSTRQSRKISKYMLKQFEARHVNVTISAEAAQKIAKKKDIHKATQEYLKETYPDLKDSDIARAMEEMRINKTASASFSYAPGEAAIASGGTDVATAVKEMAAIRAEGGSAKAGLVREYANKELRPQFVGMSEDDAIKFAEELFEKGNVRVTMPSVRGGSGPTDLTLSETLESFAEKEASKNRVSFIRYQETLERESLFDIKKEALENRPVFDEEFLNRGAQQFSMPPEEFAKRIQKAKPGDMMHPSEVRALLDATEEAFVAARTSWDIATVRGTEKNLLHSMEDAERYRILYNSVFKPRSQASAIMREFRGRTWDFKLGEQQFDNAYQVLEMFTMGATRGEIGGMSDDAFRELLKAKPFEATWKDKLYTIWISGLLSNPTTFEVNFMSTTLNIATRLGIELPLRSVFDLAASKISKVNPFQAAREQKYFMSSTARGAMGALKEIPSAVKLFGNLVKNPHLISKRGGKTGAVKFSPFVSSFGKKAESFLPGTFLGATDDALKSMARRASLITQASDQLRRSAGSARVQSQAILDLASHPSDAMIKAADAEALYVTFNNPLGRLGKNILRMRNDHWPLKIIAPFVQTPTNIAKYGFERIPVLGLATPVLAGKPITAEVMAKQAIGGIFGATAMLFAMDGKMTGSGPREPGARAVWFKNGFRPYSLIHNGKSYSYNRLEPFSSILGFAADLQEAVTEGRLSDEKYQYLATKLAFSMRNLFLDKTYTRGITEIFDALSRPDRDFEKVFKSIFGSALPSVVGSATRAKDPIVREITDPLTKPWQILQAKLPWLSEDLPPKLDNFGDPIIRGGSGLSRFLTPAPGQELLNEEWASELWRLNIGVGKGHGGSGTQKLTPEQLRELVTEQGGLIKHRLQRLVSQGWYKNATDSRRRKAVQTILRKSRAAGRKKFLRGQSSEERRRIRRPGAEPSRFPFGSPPGGV